MRRGRHICHLRSLFKEWPPSRTLASAKQASQLTGYPMHISFAVHPDLSSCIVCWPRLGYRAFQPVVTSLVGWPMRGGASPSGPSSMETSNSGGSFLAKLLAKMLTHAAVCC